MKKAECNYYEKWKGKTVWMITMDQRIQLCNIIKEAADKIPDPRWVNDINDHDVEILSGLWEHVAPFDYKETTLGPFKLGGPGRFQDPNQFQIKKLNICLSKMNIHGVSFKKLSPLSEQSLLSRMDAKRAEEAASKSANRINLRHFKTVLSEIN